MPLPLEDYAIVGDCQTVTMVGRDGSIDWLCFPRFDFPAAFAALLGSDQLDASLLLIPMVAFLPGHDPRVRGTVEAIERRLMRDGFVHRYDTATADDGLPPGEGAFSPARSGSPAEARQTFERLLSLRNDVGLLAEEYGPRAQRLVGNFPQAFSHVGLVNTALNLSPAEVSPAEERTERKGESAPGEREARP